MRNLVVLPFALFALALGGCDGVGGNGGAGGSGGSGPKDLRPSQCKIERTDDACIACVQDCCSDCGEGSECLAYAACAEACGEDIDCISDCEDEFFEGLEAWFFADICVVEDCEDSC